MVIGIIGAVAFLGIGLTGALPWVFAGPIAAAFVTGWVLTELREYLRAGAIPKGTVGKTTKQSRTVSVENSPFEEAVTIPAKSSRRYQAKLRKGEQLVVEAGADDWISLSLVSRTGLVERGKDGRNLTIEYEAKRNGNWFVCVENVNKTSLELGVTLTIEPAEE
jgi:hypothetical protein